MRVLFFVFFAAELYLGAWATEVFGFWTTLLFYFVPTFLGLPLVIFQNQLNWVHFQKQMVSGKTPDQSLFRLAAGFFGSVLLLVPSFFCRIFALLLLFPPTRYLLVFLSKGWLLKKMGDGSLKTFSQGRGFSFGRGDHPEVRVERDAEVIDIEAIRIPSSQDGSPKDPTRPKA